MPIINNKVTLAIHLGARYYPFYGEDPTEEHLSYYGSDKKLGLGHDEAIKLALREHHGIDLKSPWESKLEQHKATTLYNKYKKGILFARNSLFIILRGDDNGSNERDNFFAESLYDYAQEVVPPENLMFFGKRGEKFDSSINFISEMREALREVNGKDEFEQIELFSFGEQMEACVPQFTSEIQKGMRKPAKIIGSFCESRGLVQAQGMVGNYFIELGSEKEEVRRFSVVWNPEEDPNPPLARRDLVPYSISDKFKDLVPITLEFLKSIKYGFGRYPVY